MSEIVVYKIRSKTTGLYSTGGGNPSFTKKGKTWNQPGHVSTHIAGLHPDGKRVYADNQAEVVKCIIREEDVETTPVEQWAAELAARKAKKEVAKLAAADARSREQRRGLYLKLRKEFGDA